jgi:Flp pilus assembly protein TadD
MADAPLVVLAVEVRVPWYRPASGGHASAVAASLLDHLHLPEFVDLVYMPVEGRLKRRLERIPGARVHPEPPAAAPAPVRGEGEAEQGGMRTALGVYAAFTLFCMGVAVHALMRPAASGPGVEEVVTALVVVDTTDAAAQLGVARALVGQGRWEEAVPVLERAVRLDPDAAVPLRELGAAYLFDGRPRDALEVLPRALELEPQDAAAWRYLGRAHEVTGTREEAIAAYREAARLDPTDPVAPGELGLLLLNQGRLAEAREALDTAVRLAPEDGRFRNARGWAFQSSERPAAALEDFREATRVAPHEVTYWVDLGQEAHQRGLHREADRAFRQVQRLDPAFFEDDVFRRRMWEASKRGVTIARPGRAP